MAKKKSTELIPREWLYNPIVYSQISGDFSLMQQRLLVGIIERLQDRIMKGINYQRQMKIWPSLFADEELDQNVIMEIDPRSLGVQPANYPYLKDALEDLARIQVGFKKVGKTKDYYVIAPLFSRIEMPMSGDRRTGKIRVVMLNENVQDYFSLSMGYTTHLAKIAQIAKKKRTPRIYIFLSALKNKEDGGKPIDYKEFCRFLGIDQETFENDIKSRAKARGETVKTFPENPFRNFTKVKSQILEPTKKELDDFLKDGEVDFSFTYEPIYENDRKRGNPTSIQFHIVKGDIAIDYDELQKVKRIKNLFVENMVKWCPDLSAYDIRNVLKDVEDYNLRDFTNYCYKDLRAIAEKRQPDRLADYSLSLMKEWIENSKRPQARWKKFHAELTYNMPIDVQACYMERMELEKYENGLLLIQSPKELYELLENEYIELMKSLVKKYFGRAKVNYRMV